MIGRNNPFGSPVFEDFRTILIVLIIASLILNVIDFLTRVKPVEEQSLGEGVIIKDSKGEYYVRYNSTYKGLLGIMYPITITASLDKKDLPLLKYLVNKRNISCLVSWWKHGAAIQGIANITPLFQAPDPSYLLFGNIKKWDTSQQGGFSDREKFKEFATILYNGSMEEIVQFAQRNNCTHIAVFKDDLYDFPNIYSYLTARMKYSKEKLKKDIKNSLLYKLNAEAASFFGCQKNGLELEYQDNFSRLFRVCNQS